MKTVLTPVAALTLLFTLTGNASQSVTVSVTGEITAGTCDVSVNGGGADATVTLPTLLADDVNQTGHAGKTAFTIALSNCLGTLNTGGAFFEAGPDVNSTEYFIRNSSSTASGVAFALYASDGSTRVRPGDASGQAPYLDITSGSATQTFYVEYLSDAKTAKPGTLTGNVTYHLDYK